MAAGNRIGILLSVLLLGPVVGAKGFVPADYDVVLRTELKGGHAEADFESAQLIEFTNEVQLSYLVNPEFVFHAGVGFEFQSGRTEYFDADDKAGNQLKFEKAYIEAGRQSLLFAEVGAIPARRAFSELLVGDRPFPMLIGGFNLVDDEDFQLQAFGLRAIPTSSTLSTEAAQRETIPSLDALALTANIEVSPYLAFQAKASYYSFADVPSQVISESEFKGNRTIPLGSSNAQLLYQFRGLDYAIKANWQTTSRLETQLHYQHTRNFNAPQERGSAHLTGLQESYLWAPNRQGLFALYYFSFDQDSTIAYYGGGLHGRTNAQGYELQLGFELPDDKLLIRSFYRYSQPLFDDYPNQPITAFGLGLEMLHELI